MFSVFDLVIFVLILWLIYVSISATFQSINKKNFLLKLHFSLDHFINRFQKASHIVINSHILSIYEWIQSTSLWPLQQLDKDERSDVESEPEENEEEEEKDQSSWRKRNVVRDSRLAMLSSSCVLNNLTNQKADANRRLPKAR